MPESITPSGVYRAVNAVGESLRSEMAETRKEHAESRKEHTELLEKVRDRIHALCNSISMQTAENEKWKGIHEEKVKAAHRRLDEEKAEIEEVRKEIKKATGPGMKGWAGILIAAITGIASSIAAYFTGKNG